MPCLTSTDGTVIYNGDSAREYLFSLGFNKFEIMELIDLLVNDTAEGEYILDDITYGEVIKEENDYYERWQDGIRNDYLDEYEELEVLCDKLASGKGGTKVQYANKIMKVATRFRDNWF
jgi:hypothetical protein